MSTSYIIHLTAEGESEDIESFIAQLFQTQTNFTPQVLGEFLKTKIDLNWSKDNNEPYCVADHLFEGSSINGHYKRVLLVNKGGIVDHECVEFVFFVWWLCLHFPKLRFRFYGDDCYYSAFINVYQCGFWLAYSVTAGDDYFEFSVDDEEDEFKFDSDAIKNHLDQLFNDGLIIDKAAQNAIEFIKVGTYGKDMKDHAVIDSLQIHSRPITPELRLAAFVINLYKSVYSIAEKAIEDHKDHRDYEPINESTKRTHLSQPICEFAERLKSRS